MMGLAEAMNVVRGQQKPEIRNMRNLIAERYPDTIRALRIIDIGNAQRKRGKGYNLYKRENRTYKYLYYVRYYHNGEMLPNSWNTHTNNIDEAEAFAKENRERIIETYEKTHDPQMYKILEGFYNKASIDNSSLSERCRKEYQSVVKNKFIPFLKGRGITSFEQVTRITIGEYQDSLTEQGMKPQTVNNNMKPVKRILQYLARKRAIREEKAKRHRIRKP
jgi:hypothetical protein